MGITTIVVEPLRVTAGRIENAHFRFPAPAGWRVRPTPGGAVVLGREDDDLVVIRVEGSEVYRALWTRLAQGLFGRGPMTDKEVGALAALRSNCMGRTRELLTTHFHEAVLEQDWAPLQADGHVFAEHRARFPPKDGVSVVLRHGMWLRRGAALLATFQAPDTPQNLAAIERFQRSVELVDPLRSA